MTLNDILVLILKKAVEGLSDTGTMPVKKVMAVDHLQSVAKHNFISPIMFGSNLKICIQLHAAEWQWIFMETSSGELV